MQQRRNSADSGLNPAFAVRGARLTAIAPTTIVLLTLLLIGCAASVPQALRSPQPKPISADQVRAAPERYIGIAVRWGGSILDVRNAKSHTDVELLARPLDAGAEPRLDAEPQGRFIARVPGFLDPAEYPTDRLLSVAGFVDGALTRNVGDYPYRYPVVRVVGRHLWPATAAASDGPWMGPAWPYDPWYGWGYPPWYRSYGPYGPWY